MRTPSHFIKLPCLRSIKVENYSLFSSDFEYSLKDGMNLFVGANGLGKTTTTNLIIYGIVGFNSEISQDYFLNRGSAVENATYDSASPQAIVTLEFEIGKHFFKVARYIEHDSIRSLTIDKKSYSEEEFDNLDEQYEGKLIEYTGIKDLDDIVFLLKRFLIREEEGNYLIWDDRGGEQSKLIRLLINNEGFEEEYSKLARKVKDADTRMRGAQDTRAQFVKRLRDLEVDKERSLKHNKDQISKRGLEQKINDVGEELSDLKLAHKKNAENILYTLNEIRDRDGKIEKITEEYEFKSEDSVKLETKLFKYVYSDEKILTSIHKLKHYHICIYCNKKPSDKVVETIIKSLEVKNECPVCHSHINEPSKEEFDVNKAIRELEKSKNDLRKHNTSILKLQKQKEQMSEELNRLLKSQQKLEKDMNVKSIEIYDLKMQMSNLNRNPEEQITVFDSQILVLENQIRKYDREIQEASDELDNAKAKLIKKNEEQNRIINSFEAKLNVIFEKYTAKFFRPDCKLVTITGRPKSSNIDINSFVPSFEGKVRKMIKNCSTSERIFLEYLFRLSLLQLYCEESDNNGFMIMETTEGAFDVTNTIQLAKSFVEFGKNRIPFIVITNFSKPDFLLSIAEGINHRKNRFLNYLDIGSIKSHHKAGMASYTGIIKKLALN